MNFTDFHESPNPELQAGQNLFYSGAIKRFEKGSNIFTATVLEKSFYYCDVKVDEADGEITPIVCTCKTKLPCKHVFATLFYIKYHKRFTLTGPKLIFKKGKVSAAQLAQFYDNASLPDQILLGVLAAGFNKMGVSTMSEALKLAGLNASETTEAKIRPLLHALNNALPGIVVESGEKNKTYYGVEESLLVSFLPHVGGTDLWVKIVKAVEAAAPAFHNYYSPDVELIRRNFVLGWYSPASKLLDVVMASNNTSRFKIPFEWVLKQIEATGGKEQIDGHSILVRINILTPMAIMGLAGEIDSNWYYESIKKCHEEDPRYPSILFILVEILTLRWDKPAIDRLIDKQGGYIFVKYGLAALEALLDGQYAKAVTLYQESFKLYRKEYEIKKGYYQSYASYFYPLAVAFNKNVKDFKDAEAFVEFSMLGNPPVMTAYRELFEKLKNPSYNSLLFSGAFFSDTKYNQTHLPFVIAAWLGKEAPPMVLKRWYDRTGQLGYALYQSDLAALLEKAGTHVAANPNVHCLVEKIEEKETWMQSLEMLEALAKGKSGAILETKDSRVIWMVGFQYKEIAAMEQKRTKTGWTSGRSIAGKRLHGFMVESMTEQDRRVVKRGLKAQNSYYGPDYYWEFEEAIYELAGHPQLFLADSNNTPLQIIKADPEIIVEETKTGYQLKLIPSIDEKGAHFEKETNNRYKVYDITDRHVNLARAMGGAPLSIPTKGREALFKTLEGLSGIVTVQSNLTEHAENLPKIDADARPVVQILPLGDGFQLELFVKPFASQPPYFKPGGGSESVMADFNGKKTIAQRNFKKEEKEIKQFKEKLPDIGELLDNNLEATLEDDEQCLNVLAALNPLVMSEELSVEWPKGEKLRIHGVAGLGKFSLSVRSQQDWFGIDGEVRVDDETVLSLMKLMGLLRENPNRNFIRLDSNRYIALTRDLARRIQQLDALALTHRDELRVNNLASLRLEELGEGLANFDADTRWLEQQQKIKEAKAQKFRTPKTLLAELRPYQTEGFFWLAQMAHWGVGACLADDMGLGKTVQAIALLLQRASKGPCLVVAPTSVSNNWMQELAKFSPSLNVQLLGGNTRAATIKGLKANDVLVCSYGLMLSEAKVLEKKKFATVVLDEAQAIKNKNTKRSGAVMNLQADFRLILTGTPLENHLGELWNLFNFINPGLLGSLDYFREKFAIPIERDKDPIRREELKRLISPFILRRMKNDVLKELPPKTEIILSVTLSDEEQAFYEALRRSALQKLESSEAKAGEKQLQILAELMRLRQAACNPRLVEPDVPIGSSKLDMFGELVGELIENGHRALVFSQFVKHLTLVRQYLDSQKITYQYLDGSTPAKSRQALVDAFQNGDGELFLISLKAGGTGLNLTAADYVIHLDPWWNPAVEDQASDRAHRIGQLKPVTVYRLVSANTVEEKIVQLHEHKRDLVNSLLSDTDVSGKMNAAELLNLIKGA